jgi:hypothetical protein
MTLSDTAEIEALEASLADDADRRVCEIGSCTKTALWVIEWHCGCKIYYCDYHKITVVSLNTSPGYSWRCKEHGVTRTRIKSIRPIGLS